MKKFTSTLPLLFLLVSLVIVFIYKEPPDEGLILRVAFPYDRPVNSYEPTRIHLAPEYIFLENIYSPLVELSKEKGAPISSVAKHFQWQDGKLVFEIRDDLYTTDGYKISALDAEVSFKRLLILSGNTHGNFKELVCPGTKLTSLQDSCKGLNVKNNQLIIDTGEQKPFLLKMLAAIDFAIIPSPSIDPKTLKIVDYRNTSGPYYVESDNGKGQVVLKANKSHFHYDPTMAQEIHLQPSGVDDTPNSLALFRRGQVDLLTTIDKTNPEEVILFSDKNSNSNLHSTLNIRTFMAAFTPKGLSKFSQKQRLSIGKALKNIFRQHYLSNPGYESTDQLFPSYGDGGLDAQSLQEINKIYSSINEALNGKNLKISIIRIGNFADLSRSIVKALPGAIIVEGKNAPAFIKYKNDSEIPDIFIGGPDTGFMEDIGLITYSMNAGFFGLSKKDGNKWINEYMKLLDKGQRLERLRKLHFTSLAQGVLVPLVSAPYVALVRNNWKIELSQIYANNPLWLIKKN